MTYIAFPKILHTHTPYPQYTFHYSLQKSGACPFTFHSLLHALIAPAREAPGRRRWRRPGANLAARAPWHLHQAGFEQKLELPPLLYRSPLPLPAPIPAIPRTLAVGEPLKRNSLDLLHLFPLSLFVPVHQSAGEQAGQKPPPNMAGGLALLRLGGPCTRYLIASLLCLMPITLLPCRPS